MPDTRDLELEGPPTPSPRWDQEIARHALDELFTAARRYRYGTDFGNLLRFIGRFRFYSPFNAMLVHVQMQGASFVAPAYRWYDEFGRRIRAGARPLVILQPMGPVMFVFDVSDTEPEDDAPPLPREVVHPFEVRHGSVGDTLPRTVQNAMRDGVRVAEHDAGSQSAGQIRVTSPGRSLRVLAKQRPEKTYVDVPLRYELLLNGNHEAEEKYATLAHELGHLYCGHLGTPDQKWWPDRRGLPHELREFEAESVCYLVCTRLGIDSPSEEYLGSFFKTSAEVPDISLECVLKAAGLIEQMGNSRLGLRKA